jgi:hypothetical protein
MRSTIKFMFLVVAACVALVAGVFTAFASAPALAPTGAAAVERPEPPAGRPIAPAAAACADIQATDVAWVTLTPNHHIDKQVPAYPSGASDITPVFQYSCAPANTTIVSVFSLNGLTVYSDRESIKPRNSAGLYGYALEPVDGSPVSDGEWGVQYFNDKTLLTTGSVAVGSASSDPAQTTSATVQGVVQDKDSQAPIEGAVILVLKPGVKLQDFIQNGQQDSDVYTAGKSDSQGAFTLQKKIVRHQVFAMIVAVQGYKSLGSDTFQVNDEPDPVSITISMTK